MPLNSNKLRELVSYEYYKIEGKAPNKDNLNNTLDALRGRSIFEGDKIELNNRIAWNNNELYYDLGDFTAVKINQDGWEHINNNLPILFRKFKHQSVQVMPIKVNKGDAKKIIVNSLKNFVNLSDQEYLLFTIQLITSFIPDIPRAIANSEGTAGSGKSTLARILKKVVDPSQVEIQNPPVNQNEFCQISDHHYIVVLDNLRTIKPWLSDNICSAVTGSGISKRKLYSNDEDIIFKYKRVYFLTGINRVGNSPDLLDRSILYHLLRIDKSQRMTEERFWNEFNKLLPQFLGSVFTILSDSFSLYETIELDELPRLADFARWGEAVSRSLGNRPNHFLEAYYCNIGIQHQEVVDTNPIAKIVVNIMQKTFEWEGTPTELYDEFNNIAYEIGINTSNDPLFPKGVNKLWHRIQEVEHNLRELGVEVSRSKSGDRKIIIKKITDQDDNIAHLQGIDNKSDENLDSLDSMDSSCENFERDGLTDFELDNE